ncbi:DUF3108 domain-containing protein [Burkholderia humptydooensis]|uniref:DUF3108 domain-containing protein n=3 Tax=Burkholderia humptydooensis TaxID=430531 RepID=A0A7U4STK0_9BURK|nr:MULTISPECIES: DUF3108 domain-containing protein [Burkholderia]AJY42275.1 hypothetical protein BW21_3496 [Burkholderia sp. 2002721687]ALX43898.1 hypothetical protein AQ610_16750 [Burkholderia humptydooensis]EIP89747.1 hypothetical protein A33K_13329 [Burkholderia humptydooensis MSMB43]QPS44162.1 DUF3108 domain-containing protein [Burkholderia humptydooensis]
MPSSSIVSPNPRRVRRAAFVLALVLALHWLAALWLVRFREPFKPVEPDNVPVQVELLKPQPIERASAPEKPAADGPRAAPKRAAPAPAPRARAPRASAPVSSAVESPDESPAAASATASAAEPAGAAASGAASDATGSAASSAAAGASGAAAPPGEATKGVKFALPPSADLQYDTFYNGMQNMPGTIHWRTDGSGYSLYVSMPVPFVGPYTYESRGRVDAFGIAPARYVETRGRRPSDFAIFNRETKQIVFTGTPNSLALPDGAQDRFSMLMQLAGLVGGDPDAYRPGVTREFFVVDRDSGETWPITTIGDETISTSAGSLDARHFMRLPRRAGDARRIDIWLAPSLGWLPVRMVQTEPSGAQIELLLRQRASASDAAGERASADANGDSGAASAPTPASGAPRNADESVNSTAGAPASPPAVHERQQP